MRNGPVASGTQTWLAGKPLTGQGFAQNIHKEWRVCHCHVDTTTSASNHWDAGLEHVWPTPYLTLGILQLVDILCSGTLCYSQPSSTRPWSAALSGHLGLRIPWFLASVLDIVFFQAALNSGTLDFCKVPYGHQTWQAGKYCIYR